MQFFVRSAVGDHVIDYFVLNFTLAVGQTRVNQRIDGTFFRSDVTFTVSFNLTCSAHFYGPDCSIYCRPANSSDMGHYTCLSDGSRQCLPGYLNETTDCLTPCVPADGCSKSTTDTTCTCDQDIFPHTQRMEFAVSQESVSVYQAMEESSVMKVYMGTLINICCVAVNGIYNVHMNSFNSSLYYCCI